MSSTNSVSILYARRLGVFHVLVEKSIRIKRTESLVNGSRQNRQTGVSREEVLFTMLLQQFKQSKWPKKTRKSEIVSSDNPRLAEIFFRKRLTTRNAVRETVWAVLLCADVANGAGIKGEH
jgi:hypothetical protein